MKKHSFLFESLKKLNKEHRMFFPGIFIIIIADVTMSLLPPQLLRVIIDSNLVPMSTDGLLSRAVLYLVLELLLVAIEIGKGIMLTFIGLTMGKQMRYDMICKTWRLKSSYFTTHSTGETASRVMNDVDNINSLFSDGVISMCIDALKIIGILISIFIFSGPLTLLVLAFILILFVITRSFQKYMLKAQVKNLEQLGDMNAHLAESVKNYPMISCFGKEAYMQSRYNKKLKDNYTTVNKMNFYDSIYSPIILIIRACVIAFIVLLSVKEFHLPYLTVGMTAASIELISNLFKPVEALGMEFQNIQKGISGIKRINAFYREEEEKEKNNSITIEKITKEHSPFEIEFKNLSFAYEESHEIIKDLSLVIKKGESVTFTGRTGAGKTTLFKLLLGLLEPESGSVTIGGYPAAFIPDSLKRHLFGYVTQSFTFVTGTVADQISLAEDSITRKQIEKAMEFVGLDDYIRSLPKGYDTVVGKEVSFSQGQLQLLAIARAIVCNPPVLLLDEITANLDAETEASVVDVLRMAGKERTVLSISHRTATILHSDRIVKLG